MASTWAANPRRQLLKLVGWATGSAALSVACQSSPPSESAATQPGVSRVVLIRTDDRAAGTHQALDLLQPPGLEGNSVFLKPNFNTADPAPAATDPILLEALVLDELERDEWRHVAAEGTHWPRGYAFARPALDAGAVVNTCCLKTHRFGGQFTLSLKNTVGLVAKTVPGDSHNYMADLHSSPHQRRMIAEVNQACTPALVLLDAVEAFVDGGPDRGTIARPNVILAGTDRVAVDVVGIALLRLMGTTAALSRGSIWDLEQIQRAVELNLGVDSAERIEIVTADLPGQTMADQLRRLLDKAPEA